MVKAITGILSLLTILALPLLTGSCTDSGCVVHHFQNTKPDGWRTTDTMCYDIPSISHDGWYTLSVEMRTGETFLYRALYLAIERQMHNPERTHRDTIYYPMASDNVHMDSRGSTIQIFSKPVMNLKLKEGQYGTIRIWHLMSRETLPDIHEVGLLLHTRARSINTQEDKQ